MWIGSLALAGAPGFAGFFSKDAIIEAVGESHRFGSGYAYFCVLVGVFVTALYSFRLLYMTFHGKERFVVEHEHSQAHHAARPVRTALRDASRAGCSITTIITSPVISRIAPHESPWVVTVPLILLAIPSIVDRLADGRSDAVRRMVRQRDPRRRANDVLGELQRIPRPARDDAARLPAVRRSGSRSRASPSRRTSGCSIRASPTRRRATLHPIYNVLDHKYWFDEIYQAVFARGGIALGRGLWKRRRCRRHRRRGDRRLGRAGRARRGDRALAAVGLSVSTTRSR